MSNIKHCNDGKLRWVYDLNLYKNPTILFLVLKIFFWICFGIWLLIVILELFNSFNVWSNIWKLTKFAVILTAGWLLFCTVCYYLYALVMGGNYCVLFEMDNEGIMHKQMRNGVKRAKILGAITAMGGIATGNYNTMGAGILAATKSSMYSSFKGVKSIEVFRSRNVIKVNSSLNYNQVYAENKDFDFVLDYILKRIPPKASVRGISTSQIS